MRVRSLLTGSPFRLVKCSAVGVIVGRSSCCVADWLYLSAWSAVGRGWKRCGPCPLLTGCQILLRRPAFLLCCQILEDSRPVLVLPWQIRPAVPVSISLSDPVRIVCASHALLTRSAFSISLSAFKRCACLSSPGRLHAVRLVL